MKKQKFNLPRTFNKVRGLPIKITSPLRAGARLITIVIIIFLALMFIIGYILKILKTSDYFKIKEIITRESNTIDLSYLKEKNIFSVNLRNESRYILESSPDCSNIKLIRVLPNRIFVDFIKRQPIAFVKLYRYFSLDEDGVLFYAPNQPEELELPVILGLETKIFGPKPGKKYNIKELLLALNIIKEVKRSRVLKNYKIKKIDVTNLASASIFIPHPQKVSDYSKGQAVIGFENLEVKLGEDNIKDMISILAGLIRQEKLDLANIKYIDLRFKEPVIKFKDVK